MKKGNKYYGIFEREEEEPIYRESLEDVSFTSKKAQDREDKNQSSSMGLLDLVKIIASILFVLMIFSQFGGKGKNISGYLLGFISNSNYDPVQDTQNNCEKGDKIITIRDLHQLEEPYLSIHDQIPYAELPLCVLAAEAQHFSLNEIRISINKQNYKNYQTVYIQRSQEDDSLQQKGRSFPIHQKTHNQKTQIVFRGYSYNAYKRIINKHCQKNAVVVIVNSPLKSQAFRNINYVHQTFSSWITYDNVREKGYLQIFSFYRRVFDLIEINDFSDTNREYFDDEDPEWLALSLLELSQEHKRKIRTQSILVDATHLSWIRISGSKCVSPERKAYQKLRSLSQDHPINVTQNLKNLLLFLQNKKDHVNGYYAFSDREMSQLKGMQAIQYQQLLYLPQAHALSKREKSQYNQTRNIEKYSKQELPFCVTIASYNNGENNRYRKVMLSLLNQDYEKYRVVFIDDASSDGTLEKTRQFMEEMGFPQNRIVYVKNFQRKFHTYNIVHAAHSYCKKYEIQMFIDGKDALIGNQVLSNFNAVYQADPDIWVSYSASISDRYSYGSSKKIDHKLLSTNGKRLIGRYVGPAFTWYVSLLREVPMSYHQFKNGKWLDIIFDDALQYAFYELAGNKRISYLPQILYLRTSNDDPATEQTKKHRKSALIEISTYQALSVVTNLDSPFIRPEAQKIKKFFDKEKDVSFKDSSDIYSQNQL